MATLGERVGRVVEAAKKRLLTLRKRITSSIDKNPLRSFFGLLVIIVLLIIVGNFLRTPPQNSKQNEVPAKEVTVYSIGKAPKISLSAKIEKSGVLKLISQSAGYVQTITKWEGEAVSKGTQLMWLSNNPQGGTISSASREIAEQNYDFVSGNFNTQMELIQKRREIAEKSEAQAGELRSITDSSLGDTRNLISLNEQILSTIDGQITYLEANSPNPATDSALLQVKQGKVGVLSALTSLRSGLKNAEFQASGEQEPAELARLVKDVALKGLELEEKSLKLNSEISRLNLRIAQISESLMYPTAPCTGIIERVYVDIGESVGPGTPLASIKCDKNWTSAVVAVSPQIARNVSRIEKSIVKIGTEMVQLTPRYVTTEPTEGAGLHAIVFDIPEEKASELSDGSTLVINVPVGAAKTTSVIPYIPLDAIYQTQTESYLYVAVSENDKKIAKSRQVKLGQVYGSYVEILEGLGEADQVIVDRNVLEGDVVTFTQ